MYSKIVSSLDNAASVLESRGLVKQAYTLDAISNSIEKIAANPSSKILRKDYGLSEGDIDKAFLKKIEQAANKKGFSTRSLGDIGDTELLIVEPKKTVKGPNLLIVSGLHGNEPAGPFGVLRYLERVDEEILKKVNLTFVPLLNPTGFRKNSRDNKWGEKTNRNYVNDKDISREGKILKDNKDLLLKAAKDGMITMHEDPDAKVCFIYMYNKKESKDLGDILLNVDHMFFKQRATSEHNMEKGIVWNRHEGSLEDWLNKEGIEEIATTETPGEEPFENRVQANTMLLDAFISYYIS